MISSSSSLPEAYQHRNQTRTPSEIDITNKLARLLSKRNIKRIEKKAGQQSTSPIDKSMFFFICLSGIPPFDKEFENLGLPADMVNISLEGLKGIRTEQEYRQIFEVGGFEFEARKVRKVVEQNCNRKIIVIYHSFGTFTLMNYIRLYPDHCISGLIDIGGAPLRFYPLLADSIAMCHSIPHSFLLQNREQVHKVYLQDPVQKKAGFIPFSNSYQTILFLKLKTCPSFKSIFQHMRSLPKVLKLFLFGDKDRIFPQPLSNQKVVFYSYNEALDNHYQAKAAREFEKYYGLQQGTCKDIQDKFVFSVEGGQHSLHMQPKYTKFLQTAITQYLQILSQTLSP